MERERWATKAGLILALAGNAVGLGNFLRFPVQAAQHGGGAFMIPYFVALLLMGIPLMWVECAIGRLGGARGRGHTAGMLPLLWNHPIARYLGVLGIFIPFTVGIYYVYVQSWTLAYSAFSLTHRYFGLESRATMGAFLRGFQGVEQNHYFAGPTAAYAFFLITIGLNLWVLAGGVARGIERLAKVAMPLLFLLGIVLVVRVLSFGTPDPALPERNVSAGLGFVWNPDTRQLGDSGVWLAAAGQIFFTLSVGWGIVHTYASYLRADDDVALTGLSTASLNEFAEVVLGGTIAIPAAVVFFGAAETQEIARGGAFDLGFQALPVIFQRIPAGGVLGAVWFLLLFFAGITSSVALGQPVMALLQEDLGLSRRRALACLGAGWFIAAQPVIFFLSHGFLDEIDFWVGSFALVLFALVETVLFVWVYGMERGWAEIVRGAAIRVPPIFRPVLTWVTPLVLLAILLFWGVQQVPAKLAMRGVPPQDVPYLWGARAMMVAIFVIFALLVAAGVQRQARARRAGEGAS